MYIVVLWRMKDQLRNQNVWEKMKLYQGSIACLDLYFIMKTAVSFLVFRSATFFLVILFGIALAFINKMKSRNFCFVLFCSEWHAMISTQKYESQQYISNACPGITWNRAAPGVVPTIQYMDVKHRMTPNPQTPRAFLPVSVSLGFNGSDSPWNLYLSKLHLQNQL